MRNGSPHREFTQNPASRAVGKALASDLSPEALRAGGVGWYGATVGLSGLLASGVAGLLWDHVGHAAVFLLGATFAAVGVLALLLLVPSQGMSEARTVQSSGA